MTTAYLSLRALRQAAIEGADRLAGDNGITEDHPDYVRFRELRAEKRAYETAIDLVASDND